MGSPFSIQSSGRSDFATVPARHGAGQVAQEVPIQRTQLEARSCAAFGDLGRVSQLLVIGGRSAVT